MVGDLERLLERDGYLVYKNSGDSMNPLIKEGRDLLYITKKNRPLKRLDVVLFKRGDKYILHRIIKVRKEGLYDIVGDNRYSIEKKIKEENIIGILDSVKNEKRELKSSSFKYKLIGHLKMDFFYIRCPFIYLKLKRK